MEKHGSAVVRRWEAEAGRSWRSLGSGPEAGITEGPALGVMEQIPDSKSTCGPLFGTVGYGRASRC